MGKSVKKFIQNENKVSDQLSIEQNNPLSHKLKLNAESALILLIESLLCAKEEISFHNKYNFVMIKS